jgi:hypothetical protein
VLSPEIEDYLINFVTQFEYLFFCNLSCNDFFLINFLSTYFLFFLGLHNVTLHLLDFNNSLSLDMFTCFSRFFAVSVITFFPFFFSSITFFFFFFYFSCGINNYPLYLFFSPHVLPQIFLEVNFLFFFLLLFYYESKKLTITNSSLP